MKFKFRNALAETAFYTKYAQGQDDTWENLARRLVDDVCGQTARSPALMSKEDRAQLTEYIAKMWFMPGGRYLYYAGRSLKAFNNCYLLKAETDTREEWALLAQRAMSCLMLGGGIGVDYSCLRRRGAILSRTGGVASGPMPLMYTIDSIGNNVMQGGSRRSAIYASLNWQHPDIGDFLVAKNWDEMTVQGAKTANDADFTLWDWKQYDFNAHAPLHMTNISANYDDAWLNQTDRWRHPTFVQNVEQALRTGEPGFSFNFGDKQNETLRNACTEITSADDSDVCNLGSVNMASVPDIETFKDVVRLAAKFLVCGTIRADLPYDKVYEVRQKNRRLGLGLMGMHEWLMARRLPYAVGPELHTWLKVYEKESKFAADEHCDRLFLSRPVAYRAIAPTGTIGILAGTTTGIEPLYAVAYKRRYLKNGAEWHYQYVVDSTAQQLIKDLSVDADSIETASNLAQTPEKRIEFQADVQDYVDHAISSTINLPQWGSEHNNPDRIKEFARILSKYAPRLRGFTCYPDAGRGGQPITAVPYADAISYVGAEYREHDVCEIGNKAGVCGT
jgi:ribonucleoside-diphosphate reductase alpha chain